MSPIDNVYPPTPVCVCVCVAAWHTSPPRYRNQLLVEGISPMAAFTFFNATDPVTGTVETVASVNSTGPLSTKAASWEPLFYLPEDAACSLGRATAQYQAAHPTGPLLLMNVSVLTGVVNQEPGAWQVGRRVRGGSRRGASLAGRQRQFDRNTSTFACGSHCDGLVCFV